MARSRISLLVFIGAFIALTTCFMRNTAEFEEAVNEQIERLVNTSQKTDEAIWALQTKADLKSAELGSQFRQLVRPQFTDCYFNAKNKPMYNVTGQIIRKATKKYIEYQEFMRTASMAYIPTFKRMEECAKLKNITNLHELLEPVHKCEREDFGTIQNTFDDIHSQFLELIDQMELFPNNLKKCYNKIVDQNEPTDCLNSLARHFQKVCDEQKTFIAEHTQEMQKAISRAKKNFHTCVDNAFIQVREDATKNLHVDLIVC